MKIKPWTQAVGALLALHCLSCGGGELRVVSLADLPTLELEAAEPSTRSEPIRGRFEGGPLTARGPEPRFFLGKTALVTTSDLGMGEPAFLGPLPLATAAAVTSDGYFLVAASVLIGQPRLAVPERYQDGRVHCDVLPTPAHRVEQTELPPGLAVVKLPIRPADWFTPPREGALDLDWGSPLASANYAPFASTAAPGERADTAVPAWLLFLGLARLVPSDPGCRRGALIRAATIGDLSAQTLGEPPWSGSPDTPALVHTARGGSSWSAVWLASAQHPGACPTSAPVVDSAGRLLAIDVLRCEDGRVLAGVDYGGPVNVALVIDWPRVFAAIEADRRRYRWGQRSPR